MKYIKKNHVYGIAVAATVLGLGIVTAVLLANNSTSGFTALGSSDQVINENQVASNGNDSVASQALPAQLTGNLTVYIISSKSDIDAYSANNQVESLLPQEALAMNYYSNLGASPQGQYAMERVEVTWDNDPDGFEKGQIITRQIIKKPAETVKFFIDPELRKPDGSPVTVKDIPENYSFGNGIGCCGIELKDGTQLSASFFVVDQAYDAVVQQNLQNVKQTLQQTSE